MGYIADGNILGRNPDGSIKIELYNVKPVIDIGANNSEQQELDVVRDHGIMDMSGLPEDKQREIRKYCATHKPEDDFTEDE